MKHRKFNFTTAVLIFNCKETSGSNALISMIICGKIATTIGLVIINVMMARSGNTPTGTSMTGLETIRGLQVLRQTVSNGLLLV